MDDPAEYHALLQGYTRPAFAAAERCPVCASASIVLDRATNIHPEYPLSFKLRRCGSCGHGWIDPLPTQALLDHLYGCSSMSVIGQGWDRSAKPKLSIPEQRLLERLRSRTPGRYLEVGVGKGTLYRQVLALGWNGCGVDPGAWSAELPGVVRSLDEVPPAPAFDLIVALDVLEHISDPGAALRALRRCAAPGAEFYAAFPNNDSWRARRDKGRWRMVRPLGHLHFFTAESARRLLEDAGFQRASSATTDLMTLSDVGGVRSGLRYFLQGFGQGDQWMVWARVAPGDMPRNAPGENR